MLDSPPPCASFFSRWPSWGATTSFAQQSNWAGLEDGPKGFGVDSDQERILESELHRFVRFHRNLVYDVARAQ